MLDTYWEFVNLIYLYKISENRNLKMGYHPPYCDPSTFIFALLYLNNEFEVSVQIEHLEPLPGSKYNIPGYKIRGL